jgi:hypothetical protein
LNVFLKHKRFVRKRTAHIRDGGAHNKASIMKRNCRFRLGDKVAIDPS